MYKFLWCQLLVPVYVFARYLHVKRKECPYFSGIIARSLPHDELEAAEKVGITLAENLKLAGADAILTKAKVRNYLIQLIFTPTVQDCQRSRGKTAYKPH